MAMKKPSLVQTAREFVTDNANAPAPAPVTIPEPSLKAAPAEPADADVRLNANIRKSLHRRLKIESVERGVTIGEIVEEMIIKCIPVH